MQNTQKEARRNLEVEDWTDSFLEFVQRGKDTDRQHHKGKDKEDEDNLKENQGLAAQMGKEEVMGQAEKEQKSQDEEEWQQKGHREEKD